MTLLKNLFVNPIYKDYPNTSELINKMDPNGDPLTEYIKADGSFEAFGLDIDKLYEYSYADYAINKYLYNKKYSSLDDLYDKLVDDGKFEQINLNIDTENSFNLITEDDGINTVIGGEKALKANGQINAVIKGGSNVISNYSVEKLDGEDEEENSEEKYAIQAEREANVDITATNGSNIIQSTGTGIYATDEIQ